MPRLFVISGPSCVGKSPLVDALCRLHPDLADGMEELVLFNDRAPRPGEIDGVDYHFRTREEIEALRSDDGYVVVANRDDLQALEIASIERILQGGADALYEGNPYVPAALRDAGAFETVEATTIFLSPLSQAEILEARTRNIDLSSLVTDIQRRKLLRRTARQKGHLSLPDLENIETRARAATRELREAHHFDHVVPLHDGEGDDNWDAFPMPIGSARTALAAVVTLMRGEVPAIAERWERDLLA